MPTSVKFLLFPRIKALDSMLPKPKLLYRLCEGLRLENPTIFINGKKEKEHAF